MVRPEPGEEGDDDEPDEAGIELQVQPAGKRITNSAASARDLPVLSMDLICLAKHYLELIVAVCGCSRRGGGSFC